MSRTLRIAALLWGGSILLSRVIGLIREAAIGRMLGAGADADAYASSFVIPDFLNYLLAGGALSIVFIPIFQGHLARGDEEEGWRVFSITANFLLIALGVFTVVLWIFTPELVRVFVEGFPPEQFDRLTHLTRIILPAQIFIFVGGLLSGVLQSQDRHTLPALAPLIYGGSIVVFGLLLAPSYGAEGFSWGVLFGAAVGSFGLPFIGCLRMGLRWTPTLDLTHPDFKRYLVKSLPIMLAFSVIVADDWLIKYFASFMGEGIVAQLSYGRQIMKVPMGVFGVATGVAAYPTVSRMVGEGRLKEGYALIVSSTRMVLVLAFTAQVGLTIAGAEVATVIYGTTRLSLEQLESIGMFTGAFCLGLAGWSAQTVLARGFYAMQKTWIPPALGTVVVFLALPIYLALGEGLGPLGLAITSSIAITTYVLLLGAMLKTRMSGRDGPKLWPLVLKMVASVGIGIALGEALEGALPPLPALFKGAIAGGSGVIACLGVAHVLKVPEVGALVKKVTGKIKAKLRRA